MLNKTGFATLLLSLLLSLQLAYAAPIARQASFQRIFDGTNYFEAGEHFSIGLSTMSGDGQVVAFYGGNTQHANTLFIHDFDSTDPPAKVELGGHNLGIIRSNTGLVSNAEGTRIFFVAPDIGDGMSGNYRFCRVNGKTGEVTVIMDTDPWNLEVPLDIATDAAGEYLYFNESDNGDRGDLWRIQAAGGAAPELVIQAASVEHPSGGVGRFVDQFDVSDDGSVIAFFIEGRDHPVDGLFRINKELFVKTESGISTLTNDDEDSKDDLRISGDGSTIVFNANYEWMVTTPTSDINGQQHIEPGYRNAGERPGITTDGSVIFGRSTVVGTSAPDGYLIQSDGKGRWKMDTRSNTFGVMVTGTSEGIHLSGDGNRVAFKSVGSYGIFLEEVNYMYTGVFNSGLWSNQVPQVASVGYPAPLFTDLVDTTQHFEVAIGISDANWGSNSGVGVTLLFPDGYPDKAGSGPIAVPQSTIEEVAGGGYIAEGRTGSSWPALDPVTIRFAAKDHDGNVGYTDTVVAVASAGCSGTVETLEPGDMAGLADVSCIADNRIDSWGEVIVANGQVLYLSAPIVNLNGGFRARAGGEVIIR